MTKKLFVASRIWERLRKNKIVRENFLGSYILIYIIPQLVEWQKMSFPSKIQLWIVNEYYVISRNSLTNDLAGIHLNWESRI